MPVLQGIGILLLVIAVIAFVIWALQNAKAGKMKTVPFKKPSEIAQQGMAAADSKQLVSTEGQLVGQPLVAPMSGKPCIYYEIEVVRSFHKTNSEGQKSHETKTVMEQKQGTIVGLSEGGASVGLDCTKKPSIDLTDSHRNRVNIGLLVPGQVQFGQMTMQTESLASQVAGALLGRSETTDHYDGIEKIIPFTQGQTLYALGKLTQGPQGLAIGEPGGLGSLIVSEKGREGAMGSAAKNAKIGLIAGLASAGIGAVCTVLGFVLAPPSEAPSGGPASTSAAAAGTAATPAAPGATQPAKPGAPAKAPAKAAPTPSKK